MLDPSIEMEALPWVQCCAGMVNGAQVKRMGFTLLPHYLEPIETAICTVWKDASAIWSATSVSRLHQWLDKCDDSPKVVDVTCDHLSGRRNDTVSSKSHVWPIS